MVSEALGDILMGDIGVIIKTQYINRLLCIKLIKDFTRATMFHKFIFRIIANIQNDLNSLIFKIQGYIVKYRVMNKNNNFDVLDILLLSFTIILCYFIFFNRLDAYPLRMWDEARNSINALEMMRNKNIFVTYFDGSPDMWNTKPPLLIWITASLFEIFGISELNSRLPSATAASLVVVTIYLFSRKILKDRWVGILGALIILSSMGFSDIHIGRTGDYDALLTLWTFLAAIFFFVYIESLKNRYIYFSGLFWILAVLTKGVAGLFMAPGILIYLLLTRKLVKTVRTGATWKMGAIFILTISIYYVGREIINQGYLEAVVKEELFDRYGKQFSWDIGDFLFYWKLMASFRFQVWTYLVPLSLVIIFLTKNLVYKKFIIFSYLLSLTYFLIISGSSTKNPWYDAQLYPFLSLLTATLLVTLIRRTPIIIRILPILILIFYMQRYIRTNYAYIQRHDVEKTFDSCANYGYLFRNPPKDIKEFITVNKNESYCMPYIFYVEKEGLKRKTMDQISIGDKIITCDDAIIKSVEGKYLTSRTFSNQDGCVGLKVIKDQISNK